MEKQHEMPLQFDGALKIVGRFISRAPHSLVTLAALTKNEDYHTDSTHLSHTGFVGSILCAVRG
jgi:hypothetical protein